MFHVKGSGYGQAAVTRPRQVPQPRHDPSTHHGRIPIRRGIVRAFFFPCISLYPHKKGGLFMQHPCIALAQAEAVVEM